MRLVLTVVVDYDDLAVSEEEAEALEAAAQHLADNGMLSSDNGIVDDWSFKVENVTIK